MNQNSKTVYDMVKETFVLQECDLTSSPVRAAVAKALLEMGKYYQGEKENLFSKIVSFLNLNEEEIKMVGSFSPVFVRQAIGYAIIFDDYARGKAAYEANKETYDQIYASLSLIETEQMVRK